VRATLRWAHSDLRTHRGEALFLVLATAGIVASLLLATALFGYATNPWQRIFTQARGAHVWIHTGPSAEAGKLSALDGVESVAGPYPVASATLTSRGTRASVELRGTSERPTIGRPLITSGHWLDPANPDGVVLESRLARALLAGPGDTLALPGTARKLTVLGIADSAEPRFRPGERAGLVWALPSAVPDPDGQVTGVRLTDPDDTDYAVQRAVTVLGAGAVSEVSTWQQARAEAQGDNRLLGQVLGLFGLGALVAAGLAVHGAISTRIRGHLRDISVLKAIGFTPGQVVRVFLLQNSATVCPGASGTPSACGRGCPRTPWRCSRCRWGRCCSSAPPRASRPGGRDACPPFRCHGPRLRPADDFPAWRDGRSGCGCRPHWSWAGTRRSPGARGRWRQWPGSRCRCC
jgi:putative ABC transport system permease protein